MYPEYIKNFLNSIMRKMAKFLKWAKDLNKPFTKVDVRVANKHVRS